MSEAEEWLASLGVIFILYSRRGNDWTRETSCSHECAAIDTVQGLHFRSIGGYPSGVGAPAMHPNVMKTRDCQQWTPVSNNIHSHRADHPVEPRPPRPNTQKSSLVQYAVRFFSELFLFHESDVECHTAVARTPRTPRTPLTPLVVLLVSRWLNRSPRVPSRAVRKITLYYYYLLLFIIIIIYYFLCHLTSMSHLQQGCHPRVERWAQRMVFVAHVGEHIRR
jgi:hypothetical protein